MTANEIRETAGSEATQAYLAESSPSPAGTSGIILMLGEIAAQLAELNKSLSVFGNITATHIDAFPVEKVG